MRMRRVTFFLKNPTTSNASKRLAWWSRWWTLAKTPVKPIDQIPEVQIWKLSANSVKSFSKERVVVDVTFLHVDKENIQPKRSDIDKAKVHLRGLISENTVQDILHPNFSETLQLHVKPLKLRLSAIIVEISEKNHDKV